MDVYGVSLVEIPQKKKRELKKKTHPGISHFVGIGFFVVGKTSREICWKGI